MKSLLALVLTVILPSSPSFAAEVLSARLDYLKKNLLIDVSYRGGCERRSFSLAIESCSETTPVQCVVRLIEHTNRPDICEALVHTTALINLEKAGLKDPYFSQASFVIVGDNDSQATVTLPKIEEKKSLLKVLLGQD